MKNKLNEVSHNSLGLREDELKATNKPSILCLEAQIHGEQE